MPAIPVAAPAKSAIISIIRISVIIGIIAPTVSIKRIIPPGIPGIVSAIPAAIGASKSNAPAAIPSIGIPERIVHVWIIEGSETSGIT
jgi:hypothetical protein